MDMQNIATPRWTMLGSPIVAQRDGIPDRHDGDEDDTDVEHPSDAVHHHPLPPQTKPGVIEELNQWAHKVKVKLKSVTDKRKSLPPPGTMISDLAELEWALQMFFGCCTRCRLIGNS